MALGLLAPATATLCLQAGAQHCAQSMPDHKCCKGPRFAGCGCAIGGAGVIVAEPASRTLSQHSPLGVIDGTPAPLVVPPAEHFSAAQFDTSPPPRDIGNRLSLLSRLLV